MAQAAANASDFFKKVNTSTLKEKGAKDSYACGLTRSWVSEIFNGVQNQYLELLNTEASGVGYTEYNGT